MRKLLLLAFIVIAALFLWNKSNEQGWQWGELLRSGGQAAHSSGGGPVREWENAPDNIMAGDAALPQTQSGTAAKARLDSVRQALQNSGKR
jgi:hypothetical protein